MKIRVLRPGARAVTLHYTDDYSQPMETAYVSIEMDGDDPSMLTRWKVCGKTETAAAYAAIKRKDLPALMDVLDGFEATLPALEPEEDEEQEVAA